MDKQHPTEHWTGEERRRDVVDRRLGLDRRRGPGKRRSDERKSAEEGQMSDEQFEFLMAIDKYKRKNATPFPTWTEVLEVIKALGYRKVAEPQPLAQFKRDPAPSYGAPKCKKCVQGPCEKSQNENPLGNPEKRKTNPDS